MNLPRQSQPSTDLVCIWKVKSRLLFSSWKFFFYFFDVGYSEAFARLPLLDLRVTCYVNALIRTSDQNRCIFLLIRAI